MAGSSTGKVGFITKKGFERLVALGAVHRRIHGATGGFGNFAEVRRRPLSFKK